MIPHRLSLFLGFCTSLTIVCVSSIPAEGSARPSSNATVAATLDDPHDAESAGASSGSRLARIYWADFNGDGLEDATAITVDGRLSLLRNLGDGSFVDTTVEAGFEIVEAAVFAVWQDFDADGLLDVFIGTNRGPGRLLQNRDGTFVDVALDCGINATGIDRSAHWLDYDGDGRLDLHLVGVESNTLYHAQPDGCFVSVPLPALLTEHPRALAPLGAEGGDTHGIERSLPPGRITADDVRPANRLPRASTSALAAASSGFGSSVQPGASSSPGTPLPFACVDSLADPNGGGCIQASATATLGMLYPLSDKLFVDAATGHVGIGTLSPVSRLHVIDGATDEAVIWAQHSGSSGFNSGVIGTVSSPSGFGVRGVNFATTGFGYGLTGLSGSPDGSGVYGASSATTGKAIGVRGRTNHSEGFAGYFEGRGFFSQNVGINTLTPEERLDVAGTIRAAGFKLPTGAGAGLVLTSDVDGNATWQSGGGSGSDSDWTITGSNMYSGVSGNVGIGTTLPLEPLHVVDEIRVDGLVGSNWGEFSTNSFGTNVRSNGAPLWLNAGMPGAGEFIFLLGAKIGVGTTAPDAKLHVMGEDMKLEEQSTGHQLISSVGGSAVDLFSVGAPLYINNGSGTNEEIYLMGDRVGVGTATPEAQLHVTGTAKVGTLAGPPIGASGRLLVTNGASDGPAILASSSSTNQFYGAIHGYSNTRAAIFGEAASNGVGIRAVNFGGVAAEFTGQVKIFGTTEITSDLSVTNGASSTILFADVSAQRVGVGTNSPAFTLHVDGSAGKPGGGSWSNASDRRLKKNVQDIEGALDTLLALRGVTYEYKDPEAIHERPGTQTGMIAQEVEEVCPDWVSEAADGYKRLTFRGFEALTVEGMRELQRQLRESQQEIESLRAEMAALRRVLSETERH